MRRLGLAFGLAASVGATAAFGQIGATNPLHSGSGQPPQGGGFSGGFSGRPPEPAHDRSPDVAADEVYLPETPGYVVERVERSRQAWEELSEKLGRPVTADIPEITIGEAAREIASQIDAPVRVDELAMVDAGVAVDEVTSLQVDGLSAEAAFKQLLEPYDVAAIIDGETIAVTTEEIAENTQTLRVYPVPDLVIGVRGARRESDFSELIQLIQTTTSGPWIEIDGTGGILSPYRRAGVQALAVRQTYEVHREIEGLLHELREARPEAARRRIFEAEPRDETDGGQGRLSELRERIERLDSDSEVDGLDIPSLRERIDEAVRDRLDGLQDLDRPSLRDELREIVPSIGEGVRELLPRAEEPRPAGIPEIEEPRLEEPVTQP